MPKKKPGTPQNWPPPKGQAPDADRTTLISFVLDKSGSMGGLAEATISGFNEFKADQTAAPGRALFSLTLFDTQIYHACTAVPIAEVPDLDHASYQPGGCTALYDAVGSAILSVDRFLDAGNGPVDQVVFVVMTDGLENSSREFDRRKVFDMIADRQKTREYEFVYLGANQDSYVESELIGVAPGRSMDWAATPAGTRDTLHSLSSEMSTYRREGARQRKAWFEEEGEGEARAQ
ncbi:MAG: hypothetical protein ACNA76_08990 [Anaerosomatales bacterium]